MTSSNRPQRDHHHYGTCLLADASLRGESPSQTAQRIERDPMSSAARLAFAELGGLIWVHRSFLGDNMAVFNLLVSPKGMSRENDTPFSPPGTDAWSFEI